MKRNLKLLSGILLASFISNSNLMDIENVKARVSRNVIVNSTSNSLNNKTVKDSNGITQKNNKNSSKIDSDESTTDDNNQNGAVIKVDDEDSDNFEIQEEVDDNEVLDDYDNNTESNNSEDATTNILSVLNSDKNLTNDDIIKLSMPISHSIEFLDEFKSTFPNIDPLRQISPLFVEINDYLDVNSNETKSITKYLNGNNTSLIYSNQNSSNMLLSEINDLLKSIKEEINSQLPSTIFSLTPTLTIFNDTYKILQLEYNSIINSNSNNQITLNILLKNIQTKLLSLLDSIKEFESQLPKLIKTLDKLAESFDSSNNNEPETEIEGDLTESDPIEIEDENTEEDDDIEINDNTDEDKETAEDTTDPIENEKEDIKEEEVEIEKEETDEDINEEVEEEVDPNSTFVYFGDDGQELIYDEKSKKYYQLDPENLESEELVEYKGNVNKMTLAEYLDTEVYFDDKGNELIFDLDTNSYFLYDSEKDEFVLYTGNVTKKKIKDLIKSQEN